MVWKPVPNSKYIVFPQQSTYLTSPAESTSKLTEVTQGDNVVVVGTKVVVGVNVVVGVKVVGTKVVVTQVQDVAPYITFDIVALIANTESL